MFTDQPGVQFYTGNGLDGSPGKGGVCYPKYGAFCLEAQNYPDAINQVSSVWCQLCRIRAQKKLEFQLVIWASSSHIFLDWGLFSLVVVNDSVRRWPLDYCPSGQVSFQSYLLSKKIYVSWNSVLLLKTQLKNCMFNIHLCKPPPLLSDPKQKLTLCILGGGLQGVNPLSPNSDQHQFSPNNIHMLPKEMVMRVNKMIT